MMNSSEKIFENKLTVETISLIGRDLEIEQTDEETYDEYIDRIVDILWVKYFENSVNFFNRGIEYQEER